MTDFVSNLIKKFKPSPQKDSTSIKPNSKNLVSVDSILLNEHVKVNIYSLKEVNIDKEGVVTGNIHSKSCVVNGKVNGNILSSEYIEVKNTAVIEGNIKSGSIQIEAGSMINGFISIEKKIKLPTIISEVTDSDDVKTPDNSGQAEDVYAAAKTIVHKTETPEIKAEPVIIQAAVPEITVVAETIEEVPEIIIELPETKPEAPKIKTEVPEVPEIPKTGKIITESPLKKENTGSSNDSWW
ncbi:MAG TPA: hypothetical protein DIT07_15305 [Sphingobacteriaceae bacterium]|nr:hypothetical protein [Sphingobacteriaceae bacterium]